MGISNQPLIIERLDILNKEMGCRLLAIALGLCAVGLTMVTVCAPYWSVTLPMTQNGQMVTVQSHRGLWKACYSGAAGTNMQCNNYKQHGVAGLAQAGVIKYRAMAVLAAIFAIGGLISGVTSTNAVNVAPSTDAKNKAAGGSAGAFLLSAILILTCTSMAANKIIKKNWQVVNPNMGNMQQGLKTDLAACLSLTCSILLFMGACSDSEEEEEEYDQYQQGAPMSSYGGSQKPNYV